MKNVKNVLLGSSMLILSAGVFANEHMPINPANSNTIITETADSKDDAYALGLDLLNQLESKSGIELSSELSTSARTFKEKKSMLLNDGGYITTQELMNNQGNIIYRGLVNVTYSYEPAQED